MKLQTWLFATTIAALAGFLTAGCSTSKPTACCCCSKAPMKASLSRQSFGKNSDGKDVDLYVLTNTNGVTAKIMTRGAAIVQMCVPNRDGKLGDITLGFDTLEGYLQKENPYFGTIVGRYGNRIAKGKFSLDGKSYTLATNNAPGGIPCHLLNGGADLGGDIGCPGDGLALFLGPLGHAIDGLRHLFHGGSCFGDCLRLVLCALGHLLDGGADLAGSLSGLFGRVGQLLRSRAEAGSALSHLADRVAQAIDHLDKGVAQFIFF